MIFPKLEIYDKERRKNRPLIDSTLQNKCFFLSSGLKRPAPCTVKARCVQCHTHRQASIVRLPEPSIIVWSFVVVFLMSELLILQTNWTCFRFHIIILTAGWIKDCRYFYISTSTTSSPQCGLWFSLIHADRLLAGAHTKLPWGA